MNSKTWLTVFVVVAVLLIGASGFFAFSSANKYSVSKENWDDKVGTINSLERKDLYPNQDNVEKLKSEVEGYNKAVEELYDSLDQFQKDLNKELKNIEFQDIVKNKVNSFRKFAADSNFEIQQNESFELGFDAYSNSLPTPKIVPILDYELNAIDHLLRKMITAGSESMYLFSRDLIPGEVGGPEKQDDSVVHKYPVRIGIEASHKAFQSFMNSVSNDREYFYVVRVLQVQNEVEEGPLKSDGEQQRIPTFVNRETQSPAGIEQMTDWGYPNADVDDIIKAAEAAGYMASGRDARVLMGQERLRIFIVIDIVRFLDPSEVTMEVPIKEESGSRRKRR
ncbi:MAG: Amuc_1100 family pilus-like protein [Verrucomicrobiales bacterium]|nr:Amuc_1100 family pilus-like protein [Verrucomicrobiales bacterium]